MSNQARASDDYSFQWLDPDKKIYVLQNRRYEKAEKLILSGMLGVSSSNAYRSTYNFDIRMAYYMSETIGIEAFYIHSRNSGNNTYDALLNGSSSTIPITREFVNQFGGLLHWAPWYAKINFFNQILYFDWYLTGGLGLAQTDLDINTKKNGAPNYVADDLFTFYLGTGQLFHVSERFKVRLDFLSGIYQAPVFGDGGSNVWFSNLMFDIGIGYQL